MYGVVNSPCFDETKLKVGTIISFYRIDKHKFLRTHAGIQEGNLAILTKVESHKLGFTSPNYNNGAAFTCSIYISEVTNNEILFSVVDKSKLNFIVD